MGPEGRFFESTIHPAVLGTDSGRQSEIVQRFQSWFLLSALSRWKSPSRIRTSETPPLRLPKRWPLTKPPPSKRSFRRISCVLQDLVGCPLSRRAPGFLRRTQSRSSPPRPQHVKN